MSKDQLVYIAHILESMQDIESYMADLSFDQFMASSEKQAAVTWKLTVIGEAVAHLPADFLQLHPQIPWAAIKATRNMLVHEYFQIDTSAVWKIVVNDLPRLKTQLEALSA